MQYYYVVTGSPSFNRHFTFKTDLLPFTPYIARRPRSEIKQMDQATKPYEELLNIAESLDQLAERGHETNITEPLGRLEEAATKIGEAWSGSWLGYHANVYYKGLKPPPPGEHFSQEWGLLDTYFDGSSDNWIEFEAKDIKSAIYERAKHPDLKPADKLKEEATQQFETEQSNVISILEIEINKSSDPFLVQQKEKIENMSILTEGEVIKRLRPKTPQIMTRDTIVIGQGYWTPPHHSVLSKVLSFQRTINAVAMLSKRTTQVRSHLLRQKHQRRRTELEGTNVFIGHGRSPIWRELKDFIEDRLGLPVDEFNRVPVAGVTNTARLSEMMDAAAIAFLVMTGEDEQPDGNVRARMNVIHEAGLFQGRLGFTRAIILLEEGCEKFSNIEGLGQIRFSKGKIKSAFEEIREVLEREGILTPHQQAK